MTTRPDRTQHTGLVLSGGFLRSAFQVGVVEALDASGVRFDIVVGVSSGAWNAACVAAGQIGEMRGWWMQVTAARKLSLRDLWRNRTPLNYRTIVDTIPARSVRFDRLARSTSSSGQPLIRDWTFHVFENVGGANDFFRVVMASNYLPGLYCGPVKIDGRYYADGGFTDNVPYEAALRAGCERVFVVVADVAGRFRKRLFACAPHRIDPEVRDRITVIHPRRPLHVGRLLATPDAVHDSIGAGRDAAAEILDSFRSIPPYVT